jgi:hypothetical protein
MSHPYENLLELWDRRTKALMREAGKARLARQARKARLNRDTGTDEQVTKKAGTAAVSTRMWATLGAMILALMLVAAVAFGEDSTPCQQAYLMSGLNPQQTSFEEFVELHGDTFCAASSEPGSPGD